MLSCQAAGNTGFDRCVVFHSLSKRSNLPGLRSGFVAGDAQVIAGFAKYRTYHGCAMSVHHQEASALAWSDEEHVQANRALYQHKFAEVTKILAPHYPLDQPAGGFYHWLRTSVDDLTFTRELRRRHNVAVVPGRFLARGAQGKNPGEHHVRVAWVASVDECTEGALRLAQFAEDLR